MMVTENMTNVNSIAKDYAITIEGLIDGELYVYDGELVDINDEDQILDAIGFEYADDWTLDEEAEAIAEAIAEAREKIENEGNTGVEGLIEYFDFYDVRYVVDQNLEYMGSEIAIAIGGPNIWIETNEARVSVYWGGEEGHTLLMSQTIEEIDDLMADQYNAAR